MGVVVALLLLGGGIYAVVVWQKKSAGELAAAHVAGRLMHLRSTQFPSTCSWCKSTTLASKLLLFRKDETQWYALDPQEVLQAVADNNVERAVQVMFHQASPTWRRFCTEKCTREYFASENTQQVEAFGPCSYCGARFPMALLRCPNCAAMRKG